MDPNLLVKEVGESVNEDLSSNDSETKDRPKLEKFAFCFLFVCFGAVTFLAILFLSFGLDLEERLELFAGSKSNGVAALSLLLVLWSAGFGLWGWFGGNGTLSLIWKIVKSPLAIVGTIFFWGAALIAIWLEAVLSTGYVGSTRKQCFSASYKSVERFHQNLFRPRQKR